MGQPVSHSPPPSAFVRRGRRVLTTCGWVYLAAVLVIWLALQWVEEWWPATVLMFSPRWAFALPLVVLLPAALLLRSARTLAILLATGVIVAWPVSGFNVPWQRLTTSAPAGTPLRIMTINMHYRKSDPTPLEELILNAAPDVVTVQEWHTSRPTVLTDKTGWHVHKSMNLFLASRYPIKRAVVFGEQSDSEKANSALYELETPAGTVSVFSLHTASTRQGITEVKRDQDGGKAEVQANSDLRRQQCEFIAAEAAKCRGPVVVVGDFNTPPESPILSEVWGNYTDAFAAAGWGWGYTFIGAKTTVRIDHILASRGWYCTDCRIGPYVGSPHRPVIADLIWAGER